MHWHRAQRKRILENVIDVEHFLARAQKKIANLDVDKLREAYLFAEEKHHGQKRASGDPYILHPLAVANILLDLRPDEEMLISALLHDVVEDQDVSLEELEQRFGEQVTSMVEGLTKLSHIKAKRNDRQIGSLRKMFLAMAKDIRIVIIKLADRLHNMQTLEALPPGKQKRIARETLYIYAPIASRLGMFHLKAPLEDLAFFYLHPDEYHEISEQMIHHEIHRERIIKKAKKKLLELLEKNKIQGAVKGRVKHLYSIYKKMSQKKFQDIEDLYDLFAMRIVVSSVVECYTVLGTIHEQFRPLAKRFKDYIAVPKPNGYKSLHTTVLGLSSAINTSLPIEVQIRTEQMDQEAEYGVAAHWHYKELGSKKKAENLEDPQEWIEGLLEMEESLKDNEEFMRELSMDSFSDRIYALTPLGDIKDLPEGATPIDFAFAVHTDLGMRLHSAKANGKIIPLSYKIQNGDVIDITTQKKSKPNQNWLAWCITNRAKNKIRAFFRSQDEGSLLREGRGLLNKQLARFNNPPLDQHLSILKNYGGKKRSKKEREEVLVRIGNGSLSASAVMRNIAEHDMEDAFVIQRASPSESIAFKRDDIEKKKGEALIEIGGKRDLPIKLASCCHPKKGDAIIGFVTRGNYIRIHRKDCPMLKQLDPLRLLDAHYVGEKQMHQMLLEMTRNTTDRKGLLHDLTGIFLEEDINILDVSFPYQSSFGGKIRFLVEFEDFEHLERAIECIEELTEVESLKKVLPEKE